MSNTKSNFNRTAGPQGFTQKRDASSGERSSIMKDSSPSQLNQRELSYTEAQDHIHELTKKGHL